MAYSTLADILGIIPEEFLVQLTCDTPPCETISGAVVDGAIHQSDREIEGWLSRRYPVPLAETPMTIRVMSAKMAVHYLHVRRHIDSEIWRREYERSLAQLKDIHSGKLGLGPDDPNNAPGRDPGASHAAGGRDRVLDENTWKRFR